MSLSFLVSQEDRLAIGELALQALQEVYALRYPGESFLVELKLVNLDEIQQLNLQYRQLDEPTDVLSFPTFDTAQSLHDAAVRYPALIGSIVICPDKVVLYKESLPQMVHHGLLHLFGYDHETDLASWHQEEWSILEELRNKDLIIPAVPYEPIQLS